MKMFVGYQSHLLNMQQMSWRSTSSTWSFSHQTAQFDPIWTSWRFWTSFKQFIPESGFLKWIILPWYYRVLPKNCFCNRKDCPGLIPALLYIIYITYFQHTWYSIYLLFCRLNIWSSHCSVSHTKGWLPFCAWFLLRFFLHVFSGSFPLPPLSLAGLIRDQFKSISMSAHL